MNDKGVIVMLTKRTRICGLLLSLAAAITSLPAAATDYEVNSNADGAPAMDSLLTLREAVMAANSNTPVGDAPAGEAGDTDTISFTGLDFVTGGTITLSAGELAITESLDIDGTSGLLRVSIDGAAADRIFNIGGAALTPTVNLDNLIITNGTAANGGAVFIAQGSTVAMDGSDISDSAATGETASNGGGGVFNAGSLTLVDGAISGNTATLGSASGGGIFNAEGASLVATGTTIANNQAARAGGGIETRAAASVTLNSVTLGSDGALLTGNSAGPMPGNGGGLHMTGDGDVTVDGGSVNGNSAASEGGGLWNSIGTMTLRNALVIDGNTASGAEVTNGGGGVFNDGGTLSISDTTISNNIADGAAGSGGGVFNELGGNLQISDSSISGNIANRAGGGIEDNSGAQTTVLLTNVTLDQNNAGVDPATAMPGNGGGLHISGNGNITITGGSVTDNLAAREGGGLWNGSGTMVINGGSGEVLISGNVASGAAADDGGGGIFNNGGSLEISDANISSNIADGDAGSGGGIFGNGGSITIADSTISSNQANRAGGGMETLGAHSLSLSDVIMDANNAGVDPAVAAPGNGGAIHVSGPDAGSVDISRSMFRMNTAAREGGALWNQAGTTMSISASTVSMNSAAGAAAHDGGGGLFNNRGNLLLVDSTISSNAANGAAGSGGGIFNLGGTLSVTGGRIDENTSVRAGGGIEDRSLDEAEPAADLPTTVSLARVTMDMNSSGGNPGNGGGLHVTGGSSDVVIDQSTISNNSATLEGGGLWNFSGASLSLVNSTVSGNESSGSAADQGGGGIFNRPGGVLTLINTTVADNDAGDGQGGGLLSLGEETTVSLSNSLLGDNVAASNNDLAGAVTANYSLIESGATPAAGSNNLTGDAMLGELSTGNGGSTATHALAEASVAVNAALSSVCQADPVLARDQRNAPRPIGNCDIGAFEITNGPVVTSSSTVPAGGQTVSPGATDVEVVGFSLSNNSGEAVTVDGFSGTLSGTADFDDDFSTRLYLDGNGDGIVDSGDTELGSAMASVSINSAASSFSVDFTPDRNIANGENESYLLAIDIAGGTSTLAYSLAGGGLGLAMIGLLGAGVSRRTRWLLAATVLTATALGGCRGGGDSTPLIVDVTARFSVTTVDAVGDNSADAAVGLSLPVTGPTITIDR